MLAIRLAASGLVTIKKMLISGQRKLRLKIFLLPLFLQDGWNKISVTLLLSTGIGGIAWWHSTYDMTCFHGYGTGIPLSTHL